MSFQFDAIGYSDTSDSVHFFTAPTMWRTLCYAGNEKKYTQKMVFFALGRHVQLDTWTSWCKYKLEKVISLHRLWEGWSPSLHRLWEGWSLSIKKARGSGRAPMSLTENVLRFFFDFLLFPAFPFPYPFFLYLPFFPLINNFVFFLLLSFNYLLSLKFKNWKKMLLKKY